ncbi:MAG: proteasome activator [Actinomycetota bacterium]
MSDQVPTPEVPEVIDPPAAQAAPEPELGTVSDPAKLIRLGTMIQTLMAEVRDAESDEESRQLLARIHRETVEELGTVLSPDLMDELTEFTACCDDDGIPTEAEIRVAQAQLVGWMQGLLQGLQASMAQQQAAAAMQLQRLQQARQQPGAMAPPTQPSGGPRLPEQTGTYL